jgi:hypothetical protein
MLMKPDPGLGLDIPSARIDVPSRLVGSIRADRGRPRNAPLTKRHPVTAVRKHTMSTTLSTHPPQPAVQPAHVETQALRPTSRPNLVDKLALRLGLWLITYGRRSYAQPRREPRRRTEVVMPDRAWSSSWVQRPGA